MRHLGTIELECGDRFAVQKEDDIVMVNDHHVFTPVTLRRALSVFQKTLRDGRLRSVNVMYASNSGLIMDQVLVRRVSKRDRQDYYGDDGPSSPVFALDIGSDEAWLEQKQFLKLIRILTRAQHKEIANWIETYL